MVDTLLAILTATSNESRRELIVLSDGDLGSDLTDLSSLLLSRPGVSISTVGIGSELGGRIPIGKDLFGKSLFKKK